MIEWMATEVLRGTKRDAILYSVGANSTHGLRRTNADKRRTRFPPTASQADKRVLFGSRS